MNLLFKKEFNSMEVPVIWKQVHWFAEQIRSLYDRDLYHKSVKSVEFLTKTSFIPFALESVLKMAKETNKGDLESICTRVTKHASKMVAKAYVNLNWQLIMVCFDCIFISTDDLAYLIPMFSMVSWFLYVLQHLLQEYKKQQT